MLCKTSEERNVDKSADKTINLKRNKNREKRNHLTFWMFEHKKIVTQLNKYFPLPDLRRTGEGGGETNQTDIFQPLPYQMYMYSGYQ